MSQYNGVGLFGGVPFLLSDVVASSRNSTLKSNIGQTFVQKQIPLRNNKDTLLVVSGVITGLSQTSAQTVAEAIEIDRTALIDIDDGYKHAWSDGKHSFEGVIVSGSLVWEDSADKMPNQPYKFSVQILEWG